jgi:putative transposase
MLKSFYRRKLPHLQRDSMAHFVTFCTYERWELPTIARMIALECCLHDHESKIRVEVVTVMPDHVHIIFRPLINVLAKEVYSLAEIMDGIKGASAHRINRELRRHGRVWQTESFDRVLRSSESLDQKIDYVLNNPVRSGLVMVVTDYPWIWKKPT